MENEKKLFNLQIFRGIAATIVLLAHANLFIDESMLHGAFVQGWSGVDFFFVLSGFIIYYNHCKDLGDSDKALTYIKKRVIRVYPVYWIYTLITLSGSLLLSTIMGITIISWTDINFINVVKSLMLYPTDSNPILPVAWTLSYEIFFYFVFSLLIIFKPKLSMIVMMIWPIAILLRSLNIIDQTNNVVLRLILDAKNFEFMIGCIIAYLFLRYRNKDYKKLPIIFIVAGVTWVAFSWTNANLDYSIVGDINHSIMFGMPYALIILGGVVIENKKDVKLGKIRSILIFLGDASYSIYLTHYILITILIICFKYFFKEFNSYLVFLSISLISLIAGCIAYKIVEKPLLSLCKTKFMRKKRVINLTNHNL